MFAFSTKGVGSAYAIARVLPEKLLNDFAERLHCQSGRNQMTTLPEWIQRVARRADLAKGVIRLFTLANGGSRFADPPYGLQR